MAENTTVKERPVLFSAPMVRALLDRRKTVTRRIMKHQPGKITPAGRPLFLEHGDNGRRVRPKCPYGKPGDRLYVKETFYAWGRWETRFSNKKGRDEWHFVDMTHLMECGYQFDLPASGNRGDAIPAWHKRPSIFMPRVASRITLEITDVRVGRLQDISEEDAKAEGVAPNCAMLDHSKCGDHDGEYMHYLRGHDDFPAFSAKESFQSLWQSINGPDSWSDNPWVWCIEFRRIA